MDVVCSLHALIACFSWSNLYLDGGMAWADAGVFIEQVRLDHAYTVGDTGQFAVTTTSTVYSHEARNPYGIVALGYQIDMKSVSWSLEASHQSSTQTGRDRGVNSIVLKARWRPFR